MEPEKSKGPASSRGRKSESQAKSNFKFEAEGKRSGVRVELAQLPQPGEFENLGSRFDGAKSPDPADVAAGEKPVDAEENSNEPVRERRTRSKRNVNNPRLSLLGAPTGTKDDSIKESQAFAKARKRNFSISPSDMSKVSTAPPTPQPPQVSHQDTPLVSQYNLTEKSELEEERDDDTVGIQDSTDFDLVPPAPAPDDAPEASSPEHGEEGFPMDDDVMDDVANDIEGDNGVGLGGPDEFETDGDLEQTPKAPSSSSSKSKTAKESTESSSDQIVDNRAESQAGEDELESRPAHESIETAKSALNAKRNDEPRPDKLVDEDDRKSTEDASETEIETPALSSKGAAAKPKSVLKSPTDQHSQSVEPGDDYHDDDKEGDGFNMVHDPETPDSVREERIQREEDQMSRKSKKTKKRAPVQDSDIDTPKPAKKRKGKKKVKIKVSPRGYPAGPRDYSVVPVNELIDDDEADGLRRSKRARVAPLEFWRNERFVYGANNLDETEEEGMKFGNMPFVKSALRACETPYKKRKAPPAQAASKMSKATGKGSSTSKVEDDSEKVFDARKLKKRYDFMDGENALVWNDASDDAVSESKYLVVCLRL